MIAKPIPTILACLLIVVGGCEETGGQNENAANAAKLDMKNKKNTAVSTGLGSSKIKITPQEAVQLAKAASKEKGLDIGTTEPSTLKRSKYWIVTFHGELSSDWMGRVWVNEETGKIQEFEQNLPDHAKKTSLADKKIPKINYKGAIKIAQKAVNEKKIKTQGLKPTIEQRADLWIVTFPAQLKSGEFGPDFYAQVYINCDTGVIEEFVFGN